MINTKVMRFISVVRGKDFVCSECKALVSNDTRSCLKCGKQYPSDFMIDIQGFIDSVYSVTHNRELAEIVRDDIQNQIENIKNMEENEVEDYLSYIVRKHKKIMDRTRIDKRQKRFAEMLKGFVAKKATPEGKAAQPKVNIMADVKPKK
jgi:hypothetical protein